MARVRLSILLVILVAAVAILIGKIRRLPVVASDRPFDTHVLVPSENLRAPMNLSPGAKNRAPQTDLSPSQPAPEPIFTPTPYVVTPPLTPAPAHQPTASPGVGSGISSGAWDHPAVESVDPPDSK
jgi:hypothetical protein